MISEEEAQALTQLPPTFWAVDPIDGTVNFSNGLSQFAICAGLVANGVFELGVVCAPALDELYFTLHEGSALFNGRPFRLAHQTTANALVAASFSSKAEASQYDLFRSVNESTRGCLRTGSAALNICWAATGRLQAAFGFEAKLWDVSAALAIARAAGCELVVRPGGDALSVDYCVGTADTVQHITQLAHDHGLWS